MKNKLTSRLCLNHPDGDGKKIALLKSFYYTSPYMPWFSFLDPLFDLDFSLRISEEIELLVIEKKVGVKREYEQFEKETIKDERNSEWYDYQIDNFSDEMLFVEELERNLFHGLAVTINTTFERHAHMVIREIYKKLGTGDFQDTHTYSMSELRKILREVNHPHKESIEPALWDNLRIYTKIRNSITHHNGFISDRDTDVRSFVKANTDLFKLDEKLWKITLKLEYIKKVVSDIKVLFKLLAYNKDGTVLYY